MSRKNTIYDKDIDISNNTYTYNYKNKGFFLGLKERLMKIIKAPFMPKMNFTDNGYSIRELEGCLENIKDKMSNEDKENIKRQIIYMVRYLNSKGLSHRDIHIKNLFYENKNVFLIDYEFLIDDTSELINSYDLNGEHTLESPLLSGNMNIFHTSKYSVKSFLLPIEIDINDFLNSDTSY